MKVRIEHSFPFPPTTFWSIFFDADFEAEVATASKAEVTVLRDELHGDVRHRVIKVVAKTELPGPLRSILRNDGITYEQHMQVHEAKGYMDWQIIPASVADRATIQGRTTVTATATGCNRVVEGEVGVRVPLVGGRIEKLVADAIERTYGEGTQRMLDWHAR